MAKPKDGTVLNHCFWLNGESCLISEPSKPYIERLTKIANELEKWLLTQSNSVVQ